MKTVFVDVDTQIDFLFPAGALYVPGAERLLPAIARLNHFAAAQGIPLISTTDAHSEDDPDAEQGIAEILIAKNREGATGTRKLAYQAEYTRFSNLAVERY